MIARTMSNTDQTTASRGKSVNCKKGKYMTTEIVENDVIADIESMLNESVEGEEVESLDEPESEEEIESLDDESEVESEAEEDEEAEEAPKKDSPKQLKEKVSELEKQKLELEAQAKLMKKRMKALADTEEKYKNLIGEGYDTARKIVEHRKNKNLGGVLQELGLSSDDLIDHFKAYLPDPEKIKAEMKQQEEKKRAQLIEEQERKVRLQSLAFDASKFISKYEDKLPIISTLGEKGVDQVINTALQLRKENSPLLAGCRKFEDVLKVVLPRVERQLRKEYEPIVKRLSSSKPQEEPSKKEEKVEKKPVKSTQSKSVKLKAEDSVEVKQKGSKTKDEPKRRVDLIREEEARTKAAERELKRMFSE